MFLGRLHFKKGLDRIVQILPSVVRRYPDVMLTIAGEGDPSFGKALRNSIADQNLEDHVLMTGRLEGAVKWGAYASARLFLLPSRQENFAITVAEAMQMGVPVVISNRVNTWPFVEAAGAGVVLDETQIEGSLEAAVLLLLGDEETLRLQSERGRDYAGRHLTWSEAGRKMVECYSEILGRTAQLPRPPPSSSAKAEDGSNWNGCLQGQ